MKLMDCVELIVEKNKYAKEGVHKGMQGVIAPQNNYIFADQTYEKPLASGKYTLIKK